MMTREGQLFGNYRLLRLLGKGGFAGVYLGEHVFLETRAAIKILHTRLAQSEYKAFLQEARIIAHLEHPHIVPVLDFGLQDSIPYLVMRYAPNGSLRFPAGTWVELDMVIAYVRDIAAALSYTHEQGIVHCDIKPENLLLGRQRELLVSDFGVAAIARAFQPLSRQETGGTIFYMAPEQIEGSACPASDQYALAVVAYEWLCGVRPFTGTAEEVIDQHLHAAPPPLVDRNSLLPPSVEAAVLKALAKAPEQRFASVLDFARALKQAYPPYEQHVQPAVSKLESRAGDVKPGAAQTTGISLMPQAWSVPHRRNLFFTGREDILRRLRALWQPGAATTAQPLCVLTGLGGMGKTQAAIEYAYRYRADYQAVLWGRAETPESLLSDLAGMARVLDLEQEGHNQQRAIEAVQGWLETHGNWLLILDNAEDMSLIEEYVHNTGKGHVLITTRSQVTGTMAVGIELAQMTPAEGTLFLLRRARLIDHHAALADAPAADVVEAEDIARFMDGLPLALDQAGAYIEETGCSLFDYIGLYRRQHSALLERRGSTAHPEPVSTTWMLSFERIERTEAAATNIMKLCAFLDPEGIPEEILADGLRGLEEAPPESDAHRLDVAIAALRRFSLARRQPATQMLVMHRLVQTILRDRMSVEEQRLWAERAVQAVNRVFPAADQVEAWPRCQRYLASVWVCLAHVEQARIISLEAARLLDQAGLYLLEQAQYQQARLLFQKALLMREELLGNEHLEVANTLENLAGPYLYQGLYAQAEPLFERVLAIRTRILGAAHPEVAVSLNNLALLHQYQGAYTQAADQYWQALRIWEQNGALEHPDAARTMNNLALLHQYQGRFVEAEQLFLQAVATWERVGGTLHPDITVCFNNLALLYHRLGKFAQAEAHFQRVLEMREQTLEPEHPYIAQSLQYLGKVQQSRWQYHEAELLFKHALAIRKKSQGPEHPDVAVSLGDLARLYFFMDRYDQAERLYQQALEIYEHVSGAEHPYVATLLKRYAALLARVGRKHEAVALLAQARVINQKSSQA